MQLEEILNQRMTQKEVRREQLERAPAQLAEKNDKNEVDNTLNRIGLTEEE